jgi:hypothetical protein
MLAVSYQLSAKEEKLPMLTADHFSLTSIIPETSSLLAIFLLR